MWVGAIILGLLGSAHCLGMCGPLALALPIGNAKGIKRVFLVLSYNSGRIITYSLFGFVFGLIGYSIVLGGYQQLLSIFAGCVLLLIVLLPSNLKFKSNLQARLFGFFEKIKRKLSALLIKEGYKPLLLIGLLNGLLPCGLVYAAAVGSLATGNAWKGALFMLCFGAGTLPLMFGLSWFKQFISIKSRNFIRKATPVFVVSLALLLIVRGLIPGFPFFNGHPQNGGACHTNKPLVLCKPATEEKNQISQP